MSAVSQSATIRFFGILKNLFSRPETSGNGAPEAELSEKPAPVSPPSADPGPPALTTPARTTVPKICASADDKFVVVPLQTIVMSMSRELRAKIRSAVGEDLTVSVPIEKILPQLAKGTVKIPYGEVRRAAPDVFASGTEYDNLPVVLPLSEILPRINPTSLSRRPGQKQVEVSNDIASPFAAGGQGLTISNETPKPTPSTQFTRRVPPLTAPRAPHAVTPTRPAAKTQRIPFTVAQVTSASRVTPAPLSTPTPGAPPASAPHVRPLALRVLPAPQPVVSDAAPVETGAPPVALQSPVISDAPALTVALSALAEGWPETMRQEIVKLNLAGVQLALPCNLVEEGLKRGRVTAQWNRLRSWIHPTAVSTPSVYDEIELELPLKVLAPMFLSRHKVAAKSPHATVGVDESIPNLFFGFPQSDVAPLAQPSAAPVAAPAIPRVIAPTPAPVAASVAAPVAPVAEPLFVPVATPAQVPKAPDTNYYVWDDHADTAFVDEAQFKRKPEAPTTGGTDFIVRYATPNEIVSRAAVLDGVAGALIALPDGLMVANKIPENLNGDTLAAFLPQLFTKMSQCTKELRMGELNNLNFTVGNIPWKIFRVNAVFFAAFGHVGQGLPTAQLAALAGELDRRNKR